MNVVLIPLRGIESVHCAPSGATQIAKSVRDMIVMDVVGLVAAVQSDRTHTTGMNP